MPPGSPSRLTMTPTSFGKYTLLERISHGGMAEVFRAKTYGAAGFERIVAIKLLLPGVAGDQEFVTMLIDEAKIAGQLSHANIAQIFDLGQVDGRHYIVQEYVAGRDLRAILGLHERRGIGLPIAQGCQIALKICEALDYAHNRADPTGAPLNVVHRDVSPQNVLISYEGEVKLIDFGIAKAEGRQTRTLAGLVKGKFAYMSPEQIRGLPVDRRSDVFATGIVLHELLTGQALFLRDSDFETLKRARSAEIEPPSRLNAEVPAELDRIVLKALTRHVDDRYQTAQALRDDLWAFVQRAGAHCSRGELGAWLRACFDAPVPLRAVTGPLAALAEAEPRAAPPPPPGPATDEDLEADTQTDLPPAPPAPRGRDAPDSGDVTGDVTADGSGDLTGDVSTGDVLEVTGDVPSVAEPRTSPRLPSVDRADPTERALDAAPSIGEVDDLDDDQAPTIDHEVTGSQAVGFGGAIPPLIETLPSAPALLPSAGAARRAPTDVGTDLQRRRAGGRALTARVRGPKETRRGRPAWGAIGIALALGVVVAGAVIGIGRCTAGDPADDAR
jgi:serine/threonine protein kinase